MKSRKQTRKVPITSSAGTSGNQGPHPAGPSLEEIRLQAYKIYVDRGRTDGQDVGDWLQAEKELTEGIRQRRSA